MQEENSALQQFLTSLDKELESYVSDKEAEKILADAEQHLTDLRARYESEGDSPDDATLRALDQFDSPKTYALQFHRPWYRIKPAREERPALYFFIAQCALVIGVFYASVSPSFDERYLTVNPDLHSNGFVILSIILSGVNFLIHLQSRRLQLPLFLFTAILASTTLNLIFNLSYDLARPISLIPDPFIISLCIFPSAVGFLLSQISKALWKLIRPERRLS